MKFFYFSGGIAISWGKLVSRLEREITKMEKAPFQYDPQLKWPLYSKMLQFRTADQKTRCEEVQSLIKSKYILYKFILRLILF